MMNEITLTENWRADAMGRALLCRSRDGSPEFALMAAIKQRHPDWTILRFDEARESGRAAFARLTEGFEPVLTPLTLRADEQNQTLAGWWSAAGVEIVMAPDRYGSAEWLIAGPDADVVRALAASVQEEVARRVGRCLRFSQGSWSEAPEMADEVAAIAWSDIVLPPEQLDEIKGTVEAFFTQKEVFRRVGFPWRRGILLVGPPGTGKTLVCKAVANSQPNIPFLYVRDIAERSRGDDVSEIFQQARRVAPCIVAIEDLDGLIHDQNRTRLLNEMDGFRNNDGMLIIATSNHPHKIDEALLRRPSRFDRVYHVGVPETPERIEYGRRLLARLDALPAELDRERLAARVADQTEGFTPAFLKETYLSALLDVAQRGKDGDAEAFEIAVLEQIDALRRYLKKAKNPDRLSEFAPSSNGDGIGFRK